MRSLAGFTLLVLALPPAVAPVATAGGALDAYPRATKVSAAPAPEASGARALVPVKASPGASAPRIPLTPEQKAIEEIREEARIQVAALSARILATPDGPGPFELLRQTEEIKIRADVRCLETRLAFAHARSDLEAVREIQAALESRLRPTVRAIPSGAEKPVKGGAR